MENFQCNIVPSDSPLLQPQDSTTNQLTSTYVEIHGHETVNAWWEDLNLNYVLITRKGSWYYGSIPVYKILVAIDEDYDSYMYFIGVDANSNSEYVKINKNWINSSLLVLLKETVIQSKEAA